jgi:hypothetical protein
MPPLSRKAGWDKPDAHQGNAKGRVDHHAIRGAKAPMSRSAREE